jgi:hypothetical protein
VRKAELLGSLSSGTMSRDERIHRVQGLRRRAQLQALASTAGWMAGSAGLLLFTFGGFLSLR